VEVLEDDDVDQPAPQTTTIKKRKPAARLTTWKRVDQHSPPDLRLIHTDTCSLSQGCEKRMTSFFSRSPGLCPRTCVIGQFEVGVVNALSASAEVCTGMDHFEDQLAEAVRKYENLYNTSSKTYKDTQMANNSWKEVALTLCTEESVCCKRSRYLRDKFAKAKRVHTKKSGAPGGRKSIPALYTSLQWLDGHIKHVTTTNMTVSQVEVSNGAHQIM